jgi:glutathione S-transferase
MTEKIEPGTSASTPETGHEPIRLLTYANSPFGAKVYWALQYKGLDFELVNVNPLIRGEIGFTKQGVVPVLTVGEQWVQDSSDNCVRLDEVHPERPIAGATTAERETILEADCWVTDNIVALHFLACIDKREGAATLRNARRMATVILGTTHNMPSFFKRAIMPVWHLMLRNTGFVKRAAQQLDTTKSIATLHAEVLKGFEDRIAETGFLAGTDVPSFADIGAFAEIAFCTTHDFESTLNTSSSKPVEAWYDQMRKYFADDPTPALFPTWPPAGFGAA